MSGTEPQSKYWLNAVIDRIEETYPDGEIVVSSGISPSGQYHIGNFREILSADMIKLGLEQRGRSVRHIHVVDNFDPMRRRYDFLPESYEQYVGWPVCLVPAPDGKHASYAEQFFEEFYQNVKTLNIDVEVIKSYEDLYKTGKMTGAIETVLARNDTVKQIFSKLSNRVLPDEWTPVQVLTAENRFENGVLNTWDKANKTISGIKYDAGKAKLNWRLDWPARWALLKVMVEPHGWQEHGAAGGSYETGKQFAKQVFGIDGPIAGIQYGHLHLIGDSKKMSSSLGNVITPTQAFTFMPPELLRYLYARYPGKKRIDFDPGLGLFRLMDEFSAVDQAVRCSKPHEFAPAYKIAVSGLKTPGMASIPYNHLVYSYQAALGDRDKVFEILRRTEDPKTIEDQREAIERELDYVKNWLEQWAPNEVKFELRQELPDVNLSQAQKQMLNKFADMITANDRADGQWFHNTIHELKEEFNLPANEAFQAIYLVLLDQESGPKAGWFLSILDRDWLVERFREAAKRHEVDK